MSKMITPPSQGKVEISEDGIYWTCKCGWRNTFLDLKCPGCGNGRPVIYDAITQALCESEAITACSNQRFDTVTEPSGACCKAMREAAKKVLAGLDARIDAAPSSAKPVFNGIAELSDAINKAEAQS